MLSDLRESGSIEQDADIVGFLYRDDYYDKESDKQNIIEIIISKQRNGPIGTVELAFVKEYNKFVDLDRSEEHTSELQSRGHLVCRLLLEKKNAIIKIFFAYYPLALISIH